MKKLLLTLAACLPAMAFAQTYDTVTLNTSDMPATLATTVVTNLATKPVLNVSKQQNVSIIFSLTQSSASTSNVVFTLERSLDNVIYDTNNVFNLSIPSTGTTRNDFVTNLNVGGIGYLRLSRIANTTALTTYTNLGITYAVKRGAP